MDVSMDSGIDKFEWDKFYKLFMRPFIKCHPDSHLEITITKVKKCFAGEEWIQHVLTSVDTYKGLDRKFRQSNPDRVVKEPLFDPVDAILTLMDRDSNGVINLTEYIFARRVSFVFRKCTFGDRMNYTAVQCGMNLLTDGGRVTTDEARAILRNSIQLFSVRSSTLDFLSFYKIAS